MNVKAESPRARRAAATTERLLCEAMRLVQQTGFQGLSIHALARAADYTPGALYRYFASKDVLIAALTVRVLDRFGRVATALRERLDGDTLTEALATVLLYRDLARAAPEEFGLLSLIIAEPRVLVPNEDAAAPVSAAIHAQLAPLAARFGTARGLALFAAVHGVLVMRKQAPRVPDLDFANLLVDAVRGLCVGWGESSERVAEVLTALDALGNLVVYAGGLP